MLEGKTQYQYYFPPVCCPLHIGVWHIDRPYIKDNECRFLATGARAGRRHFLAHFIFLMPVSPLVFNQ